MSKPKRHHYKETIDTIRSEVLFYRPLFFPGIKDDVKTCQTKFSLFQSEVLTKAPKLRDHIDYVLNDLMYNVIRDFDLKRTYLKQEKKTKRHIANLQRYEHIYEQSASSPVRFLSSKKRVQKLLHKHLRLNINQLSMTVSLNKSDVRNSLTEIQFTEKGKRRLEFQRLLKIMPVPELHEDFTMAHVDNCYHISIVSPDRVWISDDNNVILKSTTADTLHRLNNLDRNLYGMHTVNSEGELIYIDRNYRYINKLSKDMETTITFIETTDVIHLPRCVYWSPYSSDLLIGMDRKVTRYDQAGQLKQTIQHTKILEQHDSTETELYRKPRYITENNNGDVVVSDDNFVSGAVVVTDREGRLRFSYTGQTSRLGIQPRGICTDALSHILVCDAQTKTILMLDKEGQFLSHLLTRSFGVLSPYSLCYDVNSHRLWVGSEKNNKLIIIRYTDHQMNSSDQEQITAKSTVSLSEIRKSMIETGQPHECNRSRSIPTFINKYHLNCDCLHISCVHSNLLVSDKNNAILINEKGETQDRLKDFKNGLYGFHTVNSEGEFIYIDIAYNIKKLSKNNKTITTCIKNTETNWKPFCVYCSPSSGDLLVGMYRSNSRTGKISRYDQSGQQTQTIEDANKGRELYSEPRYITENNNGDVVVSDYNFNAGAVVVTEREGRHRFSYIGHPPGSGLQPYGICTDVLSHILVCDDISNTVQMLNKDGHFLSHLLTKSEFTDRPRSLNYDDKTNRLWVGSEVDNMLCVFIYRFTQGVQAAPDSPDGNTC